MGGSGCSGVLFFFFRGSGFSEVLVLQWFYLWCEVLEEGDVNLELCVAHTEEARSS